MTKTEIMRISLSLAAFGKLSGIFRNRQMLNNLKRKLNNQCVPVLIYAAEP